LAAFYAARSFFAGWLTGIDAPCVGP